METPETVNPFKLLKEVELLANINLANGCCGATIRFDRITDHKYFTTSEWFHIVVWAFDKQRKGTYDIEVRGEQSINKQKFFAELISLFHKFDSSDTEKSFSFIIQ